MNNKISFASLYVMASLTASTVVFVIFKKHEFREKNDEFDKKIMLFCIKYSSETSVFPVEIH